MRQLWAPLGTAVSPLRQGLSGSRVGSARQLLRPQLGARWWPVPGGGRRDGSRCPRSGTSLQGELIGLLRDLLVNGQCGGSARQDLNDPKVLVQAAGWKEGTFTETGRWQWAPAGPGGRPKVSDLWDKVFWSSSMWWWGGRVGRA